jgi:hypothetical protein
VAGSVRRWMVITPIRSLLSSFSAIAWLLCQYHLSL